MTRTSNLSRLACLLIAFVCASPLASADATLVGPTAPGNLAASAGPAPGEISLAWDPASSLTGVTSYRVYRMLEDGTTALAAELAGDALGWTEAGLAPGTTVTYVVSAVDILAEGPASAPASATTWMLPSEPTDVAVGAGPGVAGDATVSWAAPGSDGGAPVHGYNVYRDGALVASVGAGVLSFTESGLSPLTKYSYAVAAVNVVGEGASASACGLVSPWMPEFGGCSTLP